MENCANVSASSQRSVYGWSEVGVGVKRSITWNGFSSNGKRRASSPDLIEGFAGANERTPSSSSPTITSYAGSGSIISDSTQDSFHDDQFKASGPQSVASRRSVDIFVDDNEDSHSIVSRPPTITSHRSEDIFGDDDDRRTIVSRPQTIASRRSEDIFADNDDDAVSVQSPVARAVGPQTRSMTSKRAGALFSSMDVAFDTQSVDLFSDCETDCDYYTQQRAESPDLFDNSDSSTPEAVVVPVQEDDIIDLTQNENEEPEEPQNEPIRPSKEIEIAPLPTQPLNVPNTSEEVADENGDDIRPQSQLLVANWRLRMQSDPNILLERLLGSRIVDVVPSSAPVRRQWNDDTTTVFTGDDVPCPVIGDEAREILRKIENLIADTLERLSEGKRLELSVRDRTDWSNCVFEDDVFTLMPLGQAKCRRIRKTYLLSLIFYLLGEIYEMITLQRTCTTRELYYSDTEITEKQENVNEALKLICCKLEVSPWQLGVMSSVKGLLAGKMKIFMPENVIIDCSLHVDGILLPHCTSLIERITTDAKYVLLVEKDTVFKKLVQYDISKHFGTECILITGKGYPDTNTRLMLKKIWDSHKLPIYALTDADPHGIEIMLTYRHGSRAMSNMGDALAVPSIRWIGIFPSDIPKFGINSIPMTGEDRRKLETLLNRPGLNADIYRELQLLHRSDVKAEIEGLSGSSSDYLIDVYLRNQFDNKIAI